MDHIEYYQISKTYCKLSANSLAMITTTLMTSLSFVEIMMVPDF